MADLLASKTSRLGWLLFPRASVLRTLMFAAYFDDSGTHKGSDVALLAGYIAPASEWEALEAKWNDVLKREHLRFYHAVDCYHGQEQFKGMSREKRTALHREFVSIILERQITAVAVVVGGPEFRRMYEDMARTSGASESAKARKPEYQYCFSGVLKMLAGYMAAAASEERLSLVLEDMPGEIGMTLNVFDQLRSRPEWQSVLRWLEGPPVFRPKEGYPQLQAADVLAWEMFVDLKRWRASGMAGIDDQRETFRALAAHAVGQAKIVRLTLVAYLDAWRFRPDAPGAGPSPG